MTKVVFSQELSSALLSYQPHTLRAIADDKFYQMSDHYGEFSVSKKGTIGMIGFTFSKPLPGAEYSLRISRSDNNKAVFDNSIRRPQWVFNFDPTCYYKFVCTVTFPSAVKVSKCTAWKNFIDCCKEDPASMMTFKVDGKEIKGVTRLMMSRSPVIKAMMQSDCIEAKTKTVTIEDFSYEVVKGFVLFCETAEVPLFILDLFRIADKYDVEPLKKALSDSTIEQINNMNVIKLFGFARTYHCLELEKSCIEFGVAHFMEIHESANLSAVDPEVLMDFWTVSSEYRSITKKVWSSLMRH